MDGDCVVTMEGDGEDEVADGKMEVAFFVTLTDVFFQLPEEFVTTTDEIFEVVAGTFVYDLTVGLLFRAETTVDTAI